MSATIRVSDIQAVDEFLDAEKQLSGSPPEFGASRFVRRGHAELQATWPIADIHGIVASGSLRIVFRPSLRQTTINLIFRSHCIGRLDFVPPDLCEPNPHWASTFGLPPQVCGPHFHRWAHNRQHVMDSQEWTLPARELLPQQIRRFEQAFPWLAAQVNLVLTPSQREFDIPARLLE